ncbi:MAG TPA: flagellar protein FlgN [Paucimonas sp.]|nr:flagellar protein FlgN [Paucimonas sp.]
MHITGKDPAATLNDEIAAAGNLVAVLRREQAVLIDADIETLPALTEEKAKLVAQIAVLANARYQALAAAGFPDEEAGMQAWVASPAASPAAGKAWNDLLAVVRSAKELNRTNGLLIGKHMSRNQAALNVLHGNRHANSLYGPNGQPTARTGSRGLVIG